MVSEGFHPFNPVSLKDSKQFLSNFLLICCGCHAIVSFLYV